MRRFSFVTTDKAGRPVRAWHPEVRAVFGDGRSANAQGSSLLGMTRP